MSNQVTPCCLSGFKWSGTPKGRIVKITNLDTYVTSPFPATTPSTAVLFIHDLLGWTLSNTRLLADAYATAAHTTVYVPDFFDGETLPVAPVNENRWQDIDIGGFMARNSREIREPAIFAFARALRLEHRRIAAVGFCYGGWAAFRLAAEEHDPPLVDCISVGHPSLLTERDINGLSPGIPVQILAPERDLVFTEALKLCVFESLQRRGTPFEYRYFPGVEHACFVRGDERKRGELDAMVRAKERVGAWLAEWLGEFDFDKEEAGNEA